MPEGGGNGDEDSMCDLPADRGVVVAADAAMAGDTTIVVSVVEAALLGNGAGPRFNGAGGGGSWFGGKGRHGGKGGGVREKDFSEGFSCCVNKATTR